jgi:UDP-GlcNAc:undecaprenyl-phosphate GlcNAc-1-phosphate transferase
VPGDRIGWAVAACGATVLAAEPLTIALLRRLAVLDVPGTRSSHSVPTPRGGGAPIAVGLIAAVLIAPGGGPARPALAAAIGFFGLLGLLDDLRSLPVRSRLLLQAAAAAVVALVLVSSTWLPPLALAAGVTVVAVWLVGFVNAFNFMDGVNGISGAHALIGGVAYACLAAWRGDGFGLAAGLALAAGAGAFLPWNAGQAQVFLGDVGSYSIGAALAVLAVRLVLLGVPAEAVAGPVALYLADVAWTLQRRIRGGERWLEAHRTHVYQRWCDAGWSHQEVTVLTSALTVLLCLLGVAGLHGGLAARAGADLAGFAVLAAYLGSPALFQRIGRS